MNVKKTGRIFGGTPAGILARMPKRKGIFYEIPQGMFEGALAVIPKGMLTKTLERKLSRFSKTSR